MMKEKLTKLWGKISKVLLIFLGFQFQSCIFGAMYGCPYADFNVKGTVTDEDGKGISDIQVIIDVYQSWTDDIDSTYTMLDYTDTLYTNDEGKISKKNSDIFDEPAHVRITLNDHLEGLDNGGDFESKILTDNDEIKLRQTKKGGSGWYNGAFEASFKTTLKKKS